MAEVVNIGFRNILQMAVLSSALYTFTIYSLIKLRTKVQHYQNVSGRNGHLARVKSKINMNRNR